MTVYFVDRSRIGAKNLVRYSMNATSTPKVSVPVAIRPPPCQSSPATATEPTASTIEYSAASAAIARALALR